MAAEVVQRRAKKDVKRDLIAVAIDKNDLLRRLAYELLRERYYT